jgi:uncharacterized protein (DUF342 family)
MMIANTEIKKLENELYKEKRRMVTNDERKLSEKYITLKESLDREKASLEEIKDSLDRLKSEKYNSIGTNETRAFHNELTVSKHTVFKKPTFNSSPKTVETDQFSKTDDLTLNFSFEP